MKNTQRGFAHILILVIIAVLIIGGVGYYFIKNKNQNQVSNLRWSPGEIQNNGYYIHAVDIPAMIVQKDTVFEAGKDAEFKDVEFSPDGSKVAFSVRNAAHDFGWVYEFKTLKFTPLTFQYGGGVDVIGWKNENEVTLKLTTPKPETTEKTFNLNALDEYPQAFPGKANDPVINSIMPMSGKVGSSIELKGKNFGGDGSDSIIIIENTKGQKGMLFLEPGNTASLAKANIKSKVCIYNIDWYCNSDFTVVPGKYKIYLIRHNIESNRVDFTVTE
jgi:uncharacterized protein (UPF0333 family)